MHKNLFGLASVIGSLAALVLAGAVFIQVLPSSQAQDFGPVVTGGEHPWLHFSGDFSSGAVDLYTVPADRVFVVTGACTNGVDVDLRKLVGPTSTIEAEGHSYAMDCSGGATSGFLSRGTGRITFEGGSTVRLQHTGGGFRGYVVQGYLAAP